MKLTDLQVQKIAFEIYKSVSEAKDMSFKVGEKQIRNIIASVIKENIQDELRLDQNVHSMMDELEKQNPGSFERYKMFPLLKKKLAEQKGFVL